MSVTVTSIKTLERLAKSHGKLLQVAQREINLFYKNKRKHIGSKDQRKSELKIISSPLILDPLDNRKRQNERRRATSIPTQSKNLFFSFASFATKKNDIPANTNADISIREIKMLEDNIQELLSKQINQILNN